MRKIAVYIREHVRGGEHVRTFIGKRFVDRED